MAEFQWWLLIVGLVVGGTLIVDGKVMGRFRNSWRENALIIITGVVVIGLNMLLLYQMLGGKF